MSFRHNQIGLLARLDPKKAKALIERAFVDSDDDEPGRAVDKAAKILDVGKSTLRRLITQLEEQGFEIARYTKRPGGLPEAAPPKRLGTKPRKKRAGRAA